MPLNINDSDLSPNMKQPPIEHTGPTEMLFRLIQCQVGNFLREGQALFSPGSNWRDIGGIDTSIGDRSKRVDDLEALMEEKYFRFRDPSIPLHQTALLVGRCVLAVVRLPIYRVKGRSACHSEGPKIQDDKMRDLLFATSVKVLEFDNLIRNTASTKQYLWHADISFQWHAVICMLTELRMRTVGPDIDTAWHQVGMLFTNRPQLLTKFKNALYVAIGNLVLKAWAAREKALADNMPAGSMNDQETVESGRPEYIQILIAQRACSVRKKAAAETVATNGVEQQSSTNATLLDVSSYGILGTNNNAQMTPIGIGPQESPIPSHQRRLFSPAPLGTFRIAGTHQNTNGRLAETENMEDSHTDTYLDPSVLITQGNNGGVQNWLDDGPLDWTQWDMLVQEFDMGWGDMEVG